MEITISALDMRKKLGGILDRVAKKGDHVTIMRGNVPLATLIPAKEHDKQCQTREKLRTVEDAIKELEEWQKKNQKKLKKMSEVDAVTAIREMRDSR